MTIRPRRSVLYMPGSNARALEKAKTLPVDGIIIDLEDAVAPDAKNDARKQVLEAVKAGGFLTGTPADIIESLKKIEAAYPGLSRVTVTLPLGTPLSVWLEQVERFAKEVMPAFKQANARAELAAN